MAPTPRQSKDTKAKQLAGGQAPKARVSRYLKSQESKLKEDGKSCLLLKGQRCSAVMGQVLQELRAIRAPSAKLLAKKNVIDPFDSTSGHGSLEFLTTKNDCALFAMASHNKKRPNNLVLGRTFDHQVLDIAELGILRFKSMQDYGGQVPKKRIGSKPLLLFVGDAWTSSLHNRNMQNLLIDFYRGDVVDQLVVSGLDHLITFCLSPLPPSMGSAPSGSDGTKGVTTYLHQRTYHCQLKRNPTPSKSGNNAPIPYLSPCGPDFDFTVRRTQWAGDEMYKAARLQPVVGHVKSKHADGKKNKSTNVFGETIGRLHLEKQDIEKNSGRKVKAIRKADQRAKADERAAVDRDLAQESHND